MSSAKCDERHKKCDEVVLIYNQINHHCQCHWPVGGDSLQYFCFPSLPPLPKSYDEYPTPRYYLVQIVDVQGQKSLTSFPSRERKPTFSSSSFHSNAEFIPGGRGLEMRYFAPLPCSSHVRTECAPTFIWRIHFCLQNTWTIYLCQTGTRLTCHPFFPFLPKKCVLLCVHRLV